MEKQLEFEPIVNRKAVEAAIKEFRSTMLKAEKSRKGWTVEEKLQSPIDQHYIAQMAATKYIEEYINAYYVKPVFSDFAFSLYWGLAHIIHGHALKQTEQERDEYRNKYHELLRQSGELK